MFVARILFIQEYGPKRLDSFGDEKLNTLIKLIKGGVKRSSKRN